MILIRCAYKSVIKHGDNVGQVISGDYFDVAFLFVIHGKVFIWTEICIDPSGAQAGIRRDIHINMANYNLALSVTRPSVVMLLTK